MLVFLLFYQFLLEKENMHHFKRFFLLGALLSSLIIPALVFTEYIEVATPMLNSTTNVYESQKVLHVNEPITDMDVINWSLIVWTIYGLGTIVFGLRFAKHLYQIFRRIQKNPKRKLNSLTQVLLKEKMPPHTFLSYIFLNKKALEKEVIPKAVLIHEETHAKQFHSVDVIFIELLQVIFWFNPLLYLFKRNIKLNHEFLADDAVLKEKVDAQKYQNTLLSFLSNDSSKKYQSVKMANAINYSSIKKRFKIMKKRTSKKTIVFRSLLLLTLTAFLVVGFSTTKEVLKTPENPSEITNHTARSLSIEILGDGTYNVEGNITDKNNFMEVVRKFNKDITSEIRNNILNVHLSFTSGVSNEEIWFIYNSLLDYGFYSIVTPNQEIVREKGNKPFALEDEINQDAGLSSKEKLESKSEQLTQTIQQGASREQMAEYNALAKKYNEMSQDNMHIKIKEVERMKYLYGLMSEKQREDAEPFPDFPEPPAPPSVPNFPEPPKTIGNGYDLPAPPAPPTPPSPLDHVIEMAKKGADFYYEGKKISSDEAIELLKKNKSLNIDSRSNNGKKPIVRISKDPIKIGSNNKKINVETGNISVNGKELFYTKKDGITAYFNSKGQQVDKEGQPLTDAFKRKPTYYFDGEKISSVKAHELMRNNTSIQVTNEDVTEEEYAIVLTDLNDPKNNYYNQNKNQNALIDLSEMISKDASFFYNDEPISTEKALWLTQNDEIERVQTIGSKNGTPKVYFWKKI